MSRSRKSSPAGNKNRNASHQTPRERLIQKAKDHFRDRLHEVDHPTVTTYYLDEVKRGRGFFWMYKRLTNKGYRVQFQKVNKTLTMVNGKKGYGGYPLKYLRNKGDIDSFMSILAYTATHFDERYRSARKRHRQTSNLKRYLKR